MTPQGYEETKLGTPQGGNLSPLLSGQYYTKWDGEKDRLVRVKAKNSDIFSWQNQINYWMDIREGYI